MSTIRNMRGNVMTAVLVLIAAGAGALASYTSLRSPSPTVLTPASPTELAGVLGRVGLDAEALTAAGVSAQQTMAAIDAVEAFLSTQMASLRSANATCAQAAQTYQRTLGRVQSGQATTQEAEALPTLKSSLATATSQCQSLLDSVLTAAAEELTEPQMSTLATIRLNRQRDLPMKYLVIERTEAQWAALRDALANERIAGARGESLDAASTATLLEANGQTAVATAGANLQANLATVTAAWEQAAGQ